MQTMSGCGQLEKSWSGRTQMPLAALKPSFSRATMQGRMRCSPAIPRVINAKSLPGAEKRSNMPKSAEAVTPETASIAAEHKMNLG
jgi:hypothetical protein